jgi:hypothetical protein
MKYKVGDKIRLKKLKDVNRGQYPKVVQNMDEYFGEEQTILSINHSLDTFMVTNGRSYNFSFDWVDTVKSASSNDSKPKESKSWYFRDDRIYPQRICLDVLGEGGKSWMVIPSIDDSALIGVLIDDGIEFDELSDIKYISTICGFEIYQIHKTDITEWIGLLKKYEIRYKHVSNNSNQEILQRRGVKRTCKNKVLVF